MDKGSKSSGAAFDRLHPGITAFVILVCMIATGFLYFDVARKIDSQNSASSDAVQWTLAQADVEFLAFRNSLYEAATFKIPISTVRERYDVFFSRISTFETSAVFIKAQTDSQFSAHLKAIRSWLTDVQPLIDVPDDDLRASLSKIEDETGEVRKSVRNLTLVGVRVLVAISDSERLDVAETLKSAGVLTLILIIILITMLAVLLILGRNTRRATTEKLETLARSEAIIETALDAVIVVDADGRVVEFNGSASDVFGIPRSTAMGQDMAELIVPDEYRAAHNHGMKRYKTTGELRFTGAGRLRLKAKHAKGRTFPIEVAISKVLSNGQDFFVSFLRDVSIQVANEAELVKARDDALAGERAKAKLLAVMSHEMRTPLNGMSGMLELLESSRLDERQKQQLDVMKISIRILQQHVEDVLNISLLESGKMLPQTQIFDLAGMVDEVFANQAKIAENHGNTLVLEMQFTGKKWIKTEPFMVRQILTNLIGNAIKFTRNGTVTVRIAPDEKSKGTVIDVIDTGVGIAKEDSEKVFEDFVTLDTSYSRIVGGTGLGLGITRRVVHSLNGQISLSSSLGNGSTFSVQLPVTLDHFENETAPPDQPQKVLEHTALIEPQPAQTMKILLVEDNPINRLVVRELLANQGHKIQEAHDGAEGVRMAEQTEFDLILMDISMPVLDGVQATGEIRHGDGPSKRTPIVALTAHALSEEVDRFRNAGMQDVIFKPTTGRVLAEVIERFAKTQAQVSAPPSASPTLPEPLIDQEIFDDLIQTMGSTRGQRLIGAFLESTDKDLAQIATMMDTAQAGDDLRRDVHKLCGSTGMFAAHALCVQLRLVEGLCKTGKMPEVQAAFGEALRLWPPTRSLIQSKAKELTNQP